MAALFSKPPKPEKPTPPITQDEVMLQLAQDERLSKRRGRAANMLSGQPARPGAKLGGSGATPAAGGGGQAAAAYSGGGFKLPVFSGVGGML